jgi:methyl-accepting chemotaxis protein
MQRRRKFLVKTTFQFKYAGLLIFAILFVVAIVGWNLYYEAGAIILDKTRSGDIVDLVSAYNKMLLRGLPMILLAVIVVSIFISHEVAGPLIHLEKSMLKIGQGDMTEKIHLRKGDEFKEIAQMFNDMTANMKNLIVQDRDHVQRIIFKLEDMKAKLSQGAAKPGEIDEIIKELKTIGMGYKV